MQTAISKITTQNSYSEDKSNGVFYTPRILSNYVARKMLDTFEQVSSSATLRIMDPAIGDGELLISLLKELDVNSDMNVKVFGFETDQKALETASLRLSHLFPSVETCFKTGSFLEYVLENFGVDDNMSLFRQETPECFDLIIANPPYVRTQILGSRKAQNLTKQFKLAGRVDLYHAFILAIAQVLKPKGVAGIIVSNRFMTTRSGASVRQALLERFSLQHIIDFGDSKLFTAAVLPAVLIANGQQDVGGNLPGFSSLYETHEASSAEVMTPIDAMRHSGVVQVIDGRRFLVQHGLLNTSGTLNGVWRIATKATDSWLATVKAHTWKTFGEIGKIRVGVKSCADKVFIRTDWHSLAEDSRPELLRPLITHHIARRFKAIEPKTQREILYPHEVIQGLRQAVDLSLYPKSLAYLSCHRTRLESRKYLIEAGREWYELWVPQEPSAWSQTKLVFRDIAKEPTFWIDKDGSVVNGDCYWMICNSDQTDILWLAAAVGNSHFIERFYDSCFHNKLYAGRRRFMTQYVEKFPLPDPLSDISKQIIAKSKQIYECISFSNTDLLQEELEEMVWRAFGLSVEKPAG